MKDYQRYWYFALCMEAQFTDRPGYLPNDMELLYELADCSASRNCFHREFGVVRECFKATEDGRWLYQDTALEIATAIIEKSTRNKANAQRSLSEDIEVLITNDFAVSIYNEYPRKVGRSKALSAIRKALQRIQKEEKCSEIDAAQLLQSRVQEFSKSPAGKRGQFTPHPATWFNQDRYLDETSEWYATTEEQNGKQSYIEQRINAAFGRDGSA